VHCQYDEYIGVMPGIICAAKAITSHFGYLDQVWNFSDYLHNVYIPTIRDKDVLIFALSPSIVESYRQDGVMPERLFVTPNGVHHELFRFAAQPKYPERSIYLAKVDFRKRQGIFQGYDCRIDFVGNLCPNSAVAGGFNPQSPDYLGEWSRQDVYENLTDYANLVLLSDGEAHPLVCMEALSAGLGLVVSQYATANLDLTKPFIDVIPEDKIGDKNYVRQVIEQNRTKSLAHRQEIRAYAESFAWENIVKRYMGVITEIVQKKKVPMLRASPAKPKLAIVTIATGKYYDLFFRDFEASVLDKLAPGCEIKIYCFTDHQGPAGAATEIHPARHMGWPFDTLLRFHLMASILDRLMMHDFILYMDSDMTAQAAIDPVLLSNDLVAVCHPGFLQNPCAATFEKDSMESAFVPQYKRIEYVQGCFWGGQPFAFKELLLVLTKKIDEDLARSKIPVWHDESYLNWYLADHAFLPLSPAYAFPEENYNLPIQPIVLHRVKQHKTARGVKPFNVSASKIIAGLSLEEKAEFYRLLYLRAHEKNQHAIIERRYLPDCLANRSSVVRALQHIRRTRAKWGDLLVLSRQPVHVIRHRVAMKLPLLRALKRKLWLSMGIGRRNH
jgi:hypothetical protein